jgi:DNA invertase Pin-like site-specific DNA recombinase
MAKVGYARVSSYGQSLDVQLEKLADCERIFSEKMCTDPVKTCSGAIFKKGRAHE